MAAVNVPVRSHFAEMLDSSPLNMALTLYWDAVDRFVEEGMRQKQAKARAFEVLGLAPAELWGAVKARRRGEIAERRREAARARDGARFVAMLEAVAYGSVDEARRATANYRRRHPDISPAIDREFAGTLLRLTLPPQC